MICVRTRAWWPTQMCATIPLVCDGHNNPQPRCVLSHLLKHTIFKGDRLSLPLRWRILALTSVRTPCARTSHISFATPRAHLHSSPTLSMHPSFKHNPPWTLASCSCSRVLRHCGGDDVSCSCIYIVKCCALLSCSLLCKLYGHWQPFLLIFVWLSTVYSPYGVWLFEVQTQVLKVQ
jgi:hypothetical protein